MHQHNPTTRAAVQLLQKAQHAKYFASWEQFYEEEEKNVF